MTENTNVQPQAGGEMNSNSKMLGMLCHLLGLFTGFIAPLIIWVMKKDEDQFVNANGKNALNFQFTMLIGFIAAWILMFVVIGIVLLPILGILNLIFCVIGTIKSSSGEVYQYPFSIKFIK